LIRKQEQQRVASGNAQLPETRISFLFARCRPTLPRFGAARAGTFVWPAAAAAAAALGNLLIRN